MRWQNADAMHTVEQALLDDLNTPQAIAALSAPLKTMNELLFTKKGKKARATSLHAASGGVQPNSVQML